MFCFQENHVDNVTPEALRNLLRHYETPRKLRKATAPASRRSVPPGARSAGSVPSSRREAPAAQSSTGPVMVIKTPPPATQRISAFTPGPPPASERTAEKPTTELKTPPRPSVPPPPLDSAPPEEGTD